MVTGEITKHYDMEQEEQAKLLSPAEDESSKELFCRIKKVNNVPDNRRKAKQSCKFSVFQSIYYPTDKLLWSNQF